MKRRSAQSKRALRRMALVSCLLIAACNSVLNRGELEIKGCVRDSDCAANQACSPDYTCAVANGALCKEGVEDGGCASGFCSVDGVCCAQDCSGLCQVCPGGAECKLVEAGEPGECSANNICSAEGDCYCDSQQFLGPPGHVYAAGGGPRAVVAADLSGDGKLDLAIANAGINGVLSSTLSVLLNNGDGTFTAKVDYETGAAPYSLAAIDLNSDGKLDLAVANAGTFSDPGSTVSVLLNSGDGTFAAKVDYPTGVGPKSVAAADLNNDGKPDLAVANGGTFDDPGSTVTVLLNSGDGTFPTDGGATYATGEGPSSVAAVDLNGDGRPDLAVANGGTFDDPGSTVTVLLNSGDGTFPTDFGATYATGEGPSSVVAIDLNGDGKPDLAVANLGAFDSPSSTVSVLFNSGDGTFPIDGGVSYEVGSNPSSVAAADLNGDGAPDLAVANTGGANFSSTVSVLLSSGDGAFDAAIEYAAGLSPIAVAAADLDTDGKPDLAVALRDNSAVSVLRNGGDGDFTTANQGQFYPTGASPASVVAADVNGDGKLDLATANAGDNTVSVLIDSGDGTFASKVDYPTGSLPYAIAAADLSSNGKSDLAVVNIDDGTVSVLLNSGDGTFVTRVDYPTGNQPISVTAADLSGDGVPDLAVTNAGDSTVSVLLNRGDGTFLPLGDGASYPTGLEPHTVVAADFDGDGYLDLAIATYEGGAISVLLNRGDGTFAPAVDYAADRTISLAAMDLSGDGRPDLAATDFLGEAVSVLINHGDGTFAPRLEYPTGVNPVAVAAMDLDRDGSLDLAVANYGGATISKLLNRGDGTFAPKVDSATGTSPTSLVAVDPNGDGMPDLAVASGADSTVSLLFGVCGK